MKKIILSAAAVVLMISMIGCKEGGDPKTVVMNFYDALGKKDFDEAKKYATNETKGTLDMLKSFAAMGSKDTKDEKYDKSKMIFGDPKIDGDKATVEVKNKDTNETETINLKKENGEWKVAFDKSEMMQKGMDKMNNNNGNNGTDSNQMNPQPSDTSHQ